MDAIENAVRSQAAMLTSVVVGMVMSNQWDKLYNCIAVAFIVYGAIWTFKQWRARLPTCCITINSLDQPETTAEVADFVRHINCYTGDYTAGEANESTRFNADLLIPSNGTSNYVYFDSAESFSDDPMDSPDPEIVREYTNKRAIMQFVFHGTKDSTLRGPVNVVHISIYGPKIMIENFLRFIKYYVKEMKKKEGKKYLKLFMWNTRQSRWEERSINITKTRENMFLCKENKDTIYPVIDSFIATKKLYDLVGNPWKKGILLYGPPGTGKSSFAHLIAQMVNYPIFKVSADAISKNLELALYGVHKNSVVVINDLDIALGMKSVSTFNLPDDFSNEYQHVAGSFCDNMFKLTDDARNCLLDGMMELRDFMYDWWVAKTCDLTQMKKLVQHVISEHNIQNFTRGEFLNEYITTVQTSGNKNMHTLYDILDGVGYLTGCFVVGTTNNLAAIDKTLIRPGRIDLVVKFDHADQVVVDEIFQFMLKRPGPNIGAARLSQASVISTILNNTDYERATARILELAVAPCEVSRPRAPTAAGSDDESCGDDCVEGQLNSVIMIFLNAWAQQLKSIGTNIRLYAQVKWMVFCANCKTMRLICPS